ncbi:MAG: class I fructose-bisphosphate aldolase [Patescibacteria group bacterium]
MTLHDTAKSLVRQGRGILAADESNATCDKRFTTLGIPANEEMRRAYRELLFTAPSIEKYLSGVILYDETIRQTASDGTMFHELLSAKGIHVGIKVDQGLAEDPNNPSGKLTKGLEGLAERLQEYKSMSAVFAKWRAVANVSDKPGDSSVRENASQFAAYAAICHEKGFVPIIEPEVLMDGGHTASHAEDALVEVLSVTFDALESKKIDLKGTVLKTSMAVTGKENPMRAEPREVAERTVRALRAAVPETLAGIVFLSGGQSPEEATANLNAMAQMEPLPWPITFSFSRALQGPAMTLWKGSTDNLIDAQTALIDRLSLAVAADAGGYTKEMEGI